MVGRHVSLRQPRYKALLAGKPGKVSSAVSVRLLSAVLQAATLIVIARSAEIETFGYFSSALAVGAVLTGLLSFGLPTRMLAVSEMESLGSSAASIAVTLLSAVTAGTVVFGIGIVFSGEVRWWAAAAGAYVVSEMICNLAQNLFFGEQLNRKAEVVIMVRRGIPIVLIMGFSFVVPGLVFLGAFSGFLLTALAVVLMIGRRPWRGWMLGHLLGKSFHYWTATLWAMLQQLDVLIVNIFAGPGPAGAYAAAFRLASPVHIVTSSMVSVMLPLLSRGSSGQDRRRIATKFVKVGGVYAALLAVCSPLAAVAGPWLLGSEYAEYAAVFSILILNSAMSVFNQLQSARFYAEDRARLVSIASAISTALGIGVIVVGAVYWGAVGAAFGAVSIQVVLSVILVSSWKWSGRNGHE